MRTSCAVKAVFIVILAAGAGFLLPDLNRTEPRSVPTVVTQPKKRTTTSGRIDRATPARSEMADTALPAREDSTRILSREGWRAYLRRKLLTAHSSEEILEELAILAGSKPEWALELANELSRDDDERRTLLGGVLRQWAMADSSAAWKWMIENTQKLDLAANELFITAVFQPVAASEPQKVIALTESFLRSGTDGQIPTDVALGDVVHAAIAALLAIDQDGHAQKALEMWASKPEIATHTAGAMEIVALQLAKTSPDKAGFWLDSLPSSEARTYAMCSLAAEWSKSEPERVMEWLDAADHEQGDGIVRESAFRQWVTQDTPAAATWLKRHMVGEGEATPKGDGLIASLVIDSPLIESNPALAMEWARQISNKDLRTESIAQVKTRRGSGR